MGVWRSRFLVLQKPGSGTSQGSAYRVAFLGSSCFPVSAVTATVTAEAVIICTEAGITVIVTTTINYAL